MDCSFTEFLVSARLGALTIGAQRAFVIEQLGQPTEWIGDRPNQPQEECLSWAYNRLQINFSGKDTVEDIRLFFYGREDTLCTDGFLPLRFVDKEPHTLLDMELFVAFLEEKNIAFSCESDGPGRPRIRTSPGVVALFFKNLLGVEESGGEWRSIYSKTFNLWSITASAPYRVKGVDVPVPRPARMRRSH